MEARGAVSGLKAASGRRGFSSLARSLHVPSSSAQLPGGGQAADIQLLLIPGKAGERGLPDKAKMAQLDLNFR